MPPEVNVQRCLRHACVMLRTTAMCAEQRGGSMPALVYGKCVSCQRHAPARQPPSSRRTLLNARNQKVSRCDGQLREVGTTEGGLVQRVLHKTSFATACHHALHNEPTRGRLTTRPDRERPQHGSGRHPSLAYACGMQSRIAAAFAQDSGSREGCVLRLERSSLQCLSPENAKWHHATR